MEEPALSDEEFFELSLPHLCGNIGNSVGGLKYDDMGNDRFVIKIDERLLIDPSRLSIGPMISEGLYSMVYEGLYNSKPVAIKVIQPNKTSAVSPECRERFQREVTMLARVKHENIVKFIGASMEPAMMIIIELIRGGTLQKYLWSIRPKCPDLKLSISLALDVSRVMEHLHAMGIIHCDLKPSNLLLTDDKKQIKVADFGLAREEAADEMSTDAGTYRWMAPELFSVESFQRGAKKHYDHKVDVYSFSMVLWELFTNKTPFKGRNNIMVAYAASKNRRPSVENLPRDIVPLLQSCWAEDPKRRPEFKEITVSLANFLHNLCSTQTMPPKLLEIEHPKSNMTADSAGMDLVISKSEAKGKKTRSFPIFLSCHDCLSD